MYTVAHYALALAALVVLAGCGTVRPDYLTVAAVHQSQPGHGPGPLPFGDQARSAETNLDGVQVGVAWERGRYFGDLDLTYAVHESNVAGGPWIATARVGIKVPLK